MGGGIPKDTGRESGSEGKGVRDCMTTFGQLFTGRKSPESSAPRAEPELGAEGSSDLGITAPVLSEEFLDNFLEDLSK